jgi:hypothetical protein
MQLHICDDVGYIKALAEAAPLCAAQDEEEKKLISHELFLKSLHSPSESSKRLESLLSEIYIYLGNLSPEHKAKIGQQIPPELIRIHDTALAISHEVNTTDISHGLDYIFRERVKKSLFIASRRAKTNRGRMVICFDCKQEIQAQQSQRIKPSGFSRYVRLCMRCADSVKIVKSLQPSHKKNWSIRPRLDKKN